MHLPIRCRGMEIIMEKKNIVILAMFAILCSALIVGIIVFYIYDTHKQVNDLQDTGCGLTQEDDISQPYWNSPNHTFTKGIGGYYFYNPVSRMIMFFDSKEKIMYPVCGKPDCNHDDTSCNAYLDHSYNMSVYFYKDSLYLLRTGENGDIILVQEALDGSTRKDLFEIGTGTGNTLQPIYLAFFDNAVYIVDLHDNAFLKNEDGSTKIRKRTLDGKDDSIIASFSGPDVQIENLKIYNQQVYFTLKSYSSDKDTRTNTFFGKGLYTYNPQDESVIQLTDDDVWDYTIDSVNKIMYLYIKGDALYKCDLSNIKDSKEMLYAASSDSLFCNISYDGKYLYLDNSIASNTSYTGNGNKIPIKLLILDTKGNTINSIALGSDIMFGDPNYIFIGLGGATGTSSSKGKINWKSTNWGYINKDDITQTQTISEIKSE